VRLSEKIESFIVGPGAQHARPPRYANAARI
jgi:hypothetical protein